MPDERQEERRQPGTAVAADGRPLEAEMSAADQEGQEVKMFERQVGGDLVQAGVYWSRRRGEFVIVPSEGSRLAGCADEHYVRTPLLVALAAGPLLGLAFAMFLPLSGFLVLGQLLLGRVRGILAPRTLLPALAAGPGVLPDFVPLSLTALSTSSERGPRPVGSGEDPGDQVVALARDVAAHRWQEYEDQSQAGH